jgi:hypothetical protein
MDYVARILSSPFRRLFCPLFLNSDRSFEPSSCLPYMRLIPYGELPQVESMPGRGRISQEFWFIIIHDGGPSLTLLPLYCSIFVSNGGLRTRPNGEY